MPFPNEAMLRLGYISKLVDAFHIILATCDGGYSSTCAEKKPNPQTPHLEKIYFHSIHQVIRTWLNVWKILNGRDSHSQLSFRLSFPLIRLNPCFDGDGGIYRCSYFALQNNFSRVPNKF